LCRLTGFNALAAAPTKTACHGRRTTIRTSHSVDPLLGRSERAIWHLRFNI
jgi:hypothetical protein